MYLLPCTLATQRKMRVSVKNRSELRKNAFIENQIARTPDLNVYLDDNAYIWVTKISGFLNAKAMPSA